MACVNKSNNENLILSEYYANLVDPAKKRYKDKAVMCGFDPYLLKKSECTDDLAGYPMIQYPDIVNYWVLQTSWATGSQMKAYKSMEGYNFFVSGWVNTILTKPVAGTNKVVVTARVNHSQQARETPLKTWLLVEKDGNICVAHCNCMAGLCEACSHVGAVLFAIEAGVRMRESVTCTQEKSKWIMPRYVKEIEYKPVNEIDFSSAKQKCSHFGTEKPKSVKKLRANVEEPSAEVQVDFFKNLSSCGIKPAILSLIPLYSDNYVPKVKNKLPKPLTELYNEECVNDGFEELLKKSADTFSTLNISSEEAQVVEANTRKQSSSKTWFEQQSGRVTASKFKQACKTNQDSPSKSLVKMVCYPGAHSFSSAATKWDVDNEKKARQAYEFMVADQHSNLSVADCGLHINEKWPFLGASPDGLVFCDCCGNGACEIKCPHKFRDDDLASAVLKDKDFCLVYDNGHRMHLDRKHAYYYQVQCQIFVANVEYCDFVVWTKNDIFIERVLPDTKLWESSLPKVINFYKKGILPELLGKWFTRSNAGNQQVTTADEDASWCYCRTYKKDSTLIGCDHAECTIQRFHMSCVGLLTVADGDWMCPTCINS